MGSRVAKSPTDYDKAIGQKIRVARRERKVTQQVLGNKLGLTFQQVQKYEKGVNRVSSGILYEISLALGKPINWFYDGLQGANENSAIQPVSQTAEECMRLIGELQNDPIIAAVREILLNAKSAKAAA